MHTEKRFMRNWSVDTSRFDKRTRNYKIWRIEQMVNFGLNGEKLSGDEVKRYWSKLTLDPLKKKYLIFWRKAFL